MKISEIYIGGWFQRTMLQLSEIYDFLRDGTSQLKLNKHKLAELHEGLGIGSIEYGVQGEEFISIMTSEQIRVKIFEDGLIVLGTDQVLALVHQFRKSLLISKISIRILWFVIMPSVKTSRLCWLARSVKNILSLIIKRIVCFAVINIILSTTKRARRK